jgi:hypothetical protein
MAASSTIHCKKCHSVDFNVEVVFTGLPSHPEEVLGKTLHAWVKCSKCADFVMEINQWRELQGTDQRTQKMNDELPHPTKMPSNTCSVFCYYCGFNNTPLKADPMSDVIEDFNCLQCDQFNRRDITCTIKKECGHMAPVAAFCRVCGKA